MLSYEEQCTVVLSEPAFKAKCAWIGVKPEQAPELYKKSDPDSAAAWERVVVAIINHCHEPS